MRRAGDGGGAAAREWRGPARTRAGAGGAVHRTGAQRGAPRPREPDEPDIGARLFISARTAEHHLRKVFTKLGIRGRAELKTALAELDQAEPPAGSKSTP
ncbi:helix-turn-helix domain-containing protein [Microbispora amethystogenes]|uniref:HTH luxR-type domain-containing protein n=1 Tax=Microbispora amethystogenes TaxID=1427754 RepID=A0ABQ4FF41_9ACTN|nr:helix-turn-helix transcriptional regulator [Microbispora amethystogenes]GIH33354.1 hypothetical protein Mam01_35180 [Microbispora amethystogenes]